jgi:hypothetical protein
VTSWKKVTGSLDTEYFLDFPCISLPRLFSIRIALQRSSIMNESGKVNFTTSGKRFNLPFSSDAYYYSKIYRQSLFFFNPLEKQKNRGTWVV